MSVRFKIGQRIIHLRTEMTGEIIDVNDYWGWYKVRYDNGYVKFYEEHKQDASVLMDSDHYWGRS